jgi:pimeloyl-ACP methyl ester carboxylesterase
MTLAHDVTGDGPAVVLLHSSVCDRRMWEAQVGPLAAAGHRVVRPDFRGSGDSPIIPSFSEAEDVLELLDHLDLGTITLIGSSYGGRVAQEVAARRPDRVTRLALLCAGMAGVEPGPDVVAFGDREESLLDAGDVAAATDLNVDTWLGPDATDEARALVRTMQRHNFDVQLAYSPDPEQRDTPYDLAAITAPTLVVSGGHDLPHFQSVATTLAARIPNARHHHLPWAGHFPTLERPTESTTLLLAFLTAGS